MAGQQAEAARFSVVLKVRSFLSHTALEVQDQASGYARLVLRGAVQACNDVVELDGANPEVRH